VRGASEYIVVAGVGPTFSALRGAVRERLLSVVEEDPRQLRLAFRLDHPQEGEVVKALCTVVDIGHGLSKLVVVCVDEADDRAVAPDAFLNGLFIQVEHTLHAAQGQWTGFALPPAIPVEPTALAATAQQRAAGKPTTDQPLL
jgi:hypothetical protein